VAQCGAGIVSENVRITTERRISAERSGARGMTPTIAEDVQLMLSRQPGGLDNDQVIPVGGALIELALLGRLSSVEKAGFFVDPIGRLLTVADPEPTGEAVLDAALGICVDHGRPWRIDRAIVAVRVPVLAAVHASLETRGLARATGRSGDARAYLQIVDGPAVEQCRSDLARARSLPHTVTDPHVGAVIDLLRNGGDAYRGETGPRQPRSEDWYPAESGETVDAILRGVNQLSLSL
jgi:hypothetical protein